MCVLKQVHSFILLGTVIFRWNTSDTTEDGLGAGSNLDVLSEAREDKTAIFQVAACIEYFLMEKVTHEFWPDGIEPGA